MEVHPHQPPKIAGRELVVEGADMRVQILMLTEKESIPWHYHSEIADSFICLEGPMVVESRAPRHEHILRPGERFQVPPMVAHHVHGPDMGVCRFIIIQGVAVYDNIEVGAAERT